MYYYIDFVNKSTITGTIETIPLTNSRRIVCVTLLSLWLNKEIVATGRTSLYGILFSKFFIQSLYHIDDKIKWKFPCNWRLGVQSDVMNA
jgi:hypothetical protein